MHSPVTTACGVHSSTLSLPAQLVRVQSRPFPTCLPNGGKHVTAAFALLWYQNEGSLLASQRGLAVEHHTVVEILRVALGRVQFVVDCEQILCLGPGNSSRAKRHFPEAPVRSAAAGDALEIWNSGLVAGRERVHKVM